MALTLQQASQEKDTAELFHNYFQMKRMAKNEYCSREGNSQPKEAIVKDEKSVSVELACQYAEVIILRRDYGVDWSRCLSFLDVGYRYCSFLHSVILIIISIYLYSKQKHP